jgi:FtsZ-binding cell division protein ZapB
MVTLERLSKLTAFIFRAGQRPGRLTFAKLSTMPYEREAHDTKFRQAARRLTEVIAEKVRAREIDHLSLADLAVSELEELNSQVATLRQELEVARGKLDDLNGQFLALDPAQRGWFQQRLSIAAMSGEQVAALDLDDQIRLLIQPLRADVREQLIGRLITDHFPHALSRLTEPAPALRNGAEIVLAVWLRNRLVRCHDHDADLLALKKEMAALPAGQLAALRGVLQARLAAGEHEDARVKTVAERLLSSTKKGFFGGWKVS